METTFNTTYKATGLEWYPPGTNAFTAHKALAAYVPSYVAGKRRRLAPIDKTGPEAERREIKNKRNRELMAAKRLAERINPETHWAAPSGEALQRKEIRRELRATNPLSARPDVGVCAFASI